MELVGLCRPYIVWQYANKKDPWLRQLNILEAINANIQQLLMEDLRSQVEYLVYILRLYDKYFINYEQVNGKNSNVNKESQVALTIDERKLLAVLQLRKRKSSTTLNDTIAQRPRIQSPLPSSDNYDDLDNSRGNFENGDPETEE
jgi:ribosomal protein L30/L7E